MIRCRALIARLLPPLLRHIVTLFIELRFHTPCRHFATFPDWSPRGMSAGAGQRTPLFRWRVRQYAAAYFLRRRRADAAADCAMMPMLCHVLLPLFRAYFCR